MIKKKLLTFAHRGEAQAFFEAYSFKQIEFFFDGFFESESYYLLITGEGPHNASEKTISVLSKYFDSIESVFNIGIAGSLSKKYKKNDLVWIRTAFAHHAEKLEFKSYTSASKSAQHDCMTAYGRVLATEERTKLSHFASIVDRELWAVASGAQLFKLPFFALKIISDDTSDAAEDICQFVKNEAPAFSLSLLQEFKSFCNHETKPILKKTEGVDIDLMSDPHFYFTTSQQRKLLSLLQNLELKGVDTKKLGLQHFRQLELSPKDRTRHLLQYLNDELNPVAKKIRLALAKKLEMLESAAITPGYDSDFEQDWLQLSMKIQSSRDLEKIKNALKIFSYEEFKKVLNGNIEGTDQ